jgi:hypothetical protein
LGKLQHEEWICKYIKKNNRKHNYETTEREKEKPTIVSNGKERRIFKPLSPGACG